MKRGGQIPLMALLFVWLFIAPVSTVPLQGEKALALLGFGFLAVGVLVGKRTLRPVVSHPLAVGGWGILVLSTAGSVAPRMALWGNDDRFLGVLVWAAAAVLGIVWWSEEGDVWELGEVLVLASFLSFVVALWTRWFPPPSSSLLGVLTPALQTGGTLGNASFLGVAMASVALYSAGLAGMARRSGRRAWFWGLLALGEGLAALIVGSRAAVLGLWVGMLVLGGRALTAWSRVAIGARRWLVRGWWGAGMMLPAGGIAWAISHPQGLLWRWLYRNGTLVQRVWVWYGVIKLLGRFPRYGLTGFGADTLGLLFPLVYSPALLSYEPDGQVHVFDRAHNVVLDVVYQFGIGGLVLFLGLVFVALRHARKGAARHCPAAIGALAAWVALLVMWGVHFPTPATLLLFALFLPTSLMPCTRERRRLGGHWSGRWSAWMLAVMLAWMLPYGAAWARVPLLLLAVFLWGAERMWGNPSYRLQGMFLPAIGVATIAVLAPPTWLFAPTLALLIGAWGYMGGVVWKVAANRGWKVVAVVALVLGYASLRPLMADGWHMSARIWGGGDTVKLGWRCGEQAWRLDPRERVALTMASLAFAVVEDPVEQVAVAMRWLERSPRPHTAAWWHVYLQVEDRALHAGLISREVWVDAYRRALTYFPAHPLWRRVAEVEEPSRPGSP